MDKQNSLIYDLLKTPQQVQEEQLKSVRARAAKAQQASLASMGGLSPIQQGLQRGFSALQARQGEALARRNAGLGKAAGGLLGALGKEELGQKVAESQLTPEAQQAAQLQRQVGGMPKKTSQDLMAVADKLDSIGQSQKAEQFRDRARQLQQSEQTTQLNQLRLDKADIELDNAKEEVRLRKELSEGVTTSLDNISEDIISTEEKDILRSIDPSTASTYILEAKKAEKAKKKRAGVLDQINTMMSAGEGKDNKIATLNKAIAFATNQGEKELADTLKGMRDSEQKTRDTEEDLKDKFNKDKKLDTQAEVVDNANKLIQLLDSDSPTGAKDLAAIFTFMKALDPRSTVREGEADAASSVGGFLSTITSLGDKVAKGQKLSPEAREQIKQAAILLGKTAAKTYNDQIASVRETYEGRGYNGNYITTGRTPLTINTAPSRDNKTSDAETVGSGF